MKIAFREKTRLSKDSLKRLGQINDIIGEYHEQGYILTLRQLYYQLVSREIIPNNVREYDKISNILTKGRMSGLVDWDAIEDRIRYPRLPYYADDIKSGMRDHMRHYRLDRQEGQPNYIELWVEKDALSNVLSVKTYHYHVRLMVNRGYSSCTAMFDSYNRILDALVDGKESATILYLGDHDPSGLDMVRDIKARLLEFLTNSDDLKRDFIGETRESFSKEDIVELIEEKLTVKHIGLTTEQVKLYNPPPNPAKMSDPRANDYVTKHGYTSWEVDALNPSTLHQLIDENIESLIDIDLFNEKIEEEKDHIQEMEKMIVLSQNVKDFRQYLKHGLANSKTKKEKDIFTKIFLEHNKII